MKVLMINSVCGIRSTGRICTDLAQALEAQGHTVKIAYGREQVPEQYQKYAVRIGTDLDVKIAGAEARLLDNAGFSNRRATEKFIEWVKKYDPDVIHLHNIHGYYINAEVLFNYLKVCGKKIIWTLHDCWAFTGHSAYCDAIKCTRWENGCHNCPQTKEYPKSYIDQSKKNWKRKKELFTGVPNMTIVTPSHWLAGLVKKSFLKKYSVEVIHNGIDTTKFYPLKNDFREINHLEDKFILLGVATSWDKMKGLDEFVKLANLLDDSYKIVLVGLTDEQLGKLPKKILGIKRTNSVKELAYIYSAADLFLNLTYCDTYPTVNLESVKCGTPVLTYETGGSTEIVEQYGGYVVPQGDLNVVVKKVEEIRKVANVKKDTDIKPVNIEEIDYHTAVKNYLKVYDVDSRNRKFIRNAKTPILTGGGYGEVKQRYGLIGKYVILGVAAIWDRRKGFDDFLRLNQELDDNHQIILVGVTEGQKAQLPRNIIGITRTNNVAELRELYGIADVFFNPTYEDNYPTVNLEAKACGTRVVTYRTGGSPESVPKEDVVETGYVNRGIDKRLLG